MGGPAAAAQSVTGAVVGHLWWWSVFGDNNGGAAPAWSRAPEFLRALIGEYGRPAGNLGPGSGVYVQPPREQVRRSRCPTYVKWPPTPCLRLYCGFEDAIEVFDVHQPGEGTRLHTTPSKKSRDGLKGSLALSLPRRRWRALTPTLIGRHHRSARICARRVNGHLRRRFT